MHWLHLHSHVYRSIELLTLRNLRLLLNCSDGCLVLYHSSDIDDPFSVLDLWEFHGLLHIWITGICRASHWSCGNPAVASSRQHPRSCRCTGSVASSRSSARLNRTHLPFVTTGHVHHFVLALHCAGASQSVFWISWMVGTVSAQLTVVHRRGMNCACGNSSVFAIFGP